MDVGFGPQWCLLDEDLFQPLYASSVVNMGAVQYVDLDLFALMRMVLQCWYA